MRCLYCGKPLPLLKKLTGGGEFCSDAHRHKYQEEYNKLALSRLLQAQSAPGETGVFPTPGGGSGLRQLAAPAAPQPMTGQRALPPPSTPAAPPSLPPTAHHQDEKSNPFSPPRAMAPPPPAPPPQPTPPKDAPFLIAQHQPIGPGESVGIPHHLEMIFEQSRPQIGTPDLAAIPFDWEAVASEIATSQEPDPPEAPAWVHPIAVRIPSEPLPYQAALFSRELFGASPLFPILRNVSPRARLPLSVRPKINLPIEKEVVRVVPGELRLSTVRDWELNLNTPEWRPRFAAIGAPAPPPPAPAAELAPPPAIAPTPVSAVEPVEVPVAVAVKPVEVFVDLSALGIFE